MYKRVPRRRSSKLRDEEANEMSLILKTKKTTNSRISENLPKHGGFRITKLVVSTDRENGIGDVLVILSSGRLPTVERYVFGKWLWDELTIEEMEFFLALPSTLTNPITYACLRARANGVPKVQIRERLNRIPFKVTFPSRQQYISLKQLSVTVIRQTLILRKVPKYSGYSRHHNDKGSINPFQLEGNFIPTETMVPSNVCEEKLIFDFLVTGELNLFSGDSI